MFKKAESGAAVRFYVAYVKPLAVHILREVWLALLRDLRRGTDSNQFCSQCQRERERETLYPPRKLRRWCAYLTKRERSV